MNMNIEVLMDLRVALDHLTPRDREIVEARSYGLPFSQIGRELGISGESVNRRYQKAVVSLRSLMERRNRSVALDPAKVRRIIGNANATPCPTCGR